MVIDYTLLHCLERWNGRPPDVDIGVQAEWTKSGDMVVDDSEAEQEAGAAGGVFHDFP